MGAVSRDILLADASFSAASGSADVPNKLAFVLLHTPAYFGLLRLQARVRGALARARVRRLVQQQKARVVEELKAAGEPKEPVSPSKQMAHANMQTEITDVKKDAGCDTSSLPDEPQLEPSTAAQVRADPEEPPTKALAIYYTPPPQLIDPFRPNAPVAQVVLEDATTRLRQRPPSAHQPYTREFVRDFVMHHSDGSFKPPLSWTKRFESHVLYPPRPDALTTTLDGSAVAAAPAGSTSSADGGTLSTLSPSPMSPTGEAAAATAVPVSAAAASNTPTTAADYLSSKKVARAAPWKLMQAQK